MPWTCGTNFNLGLTPMNISNIDIIVILYAFITIYLVFVNLSIKMAL